MPIKAVIFDMDGVVIDSEEVHKQTEIETLKHFGGDPSSVDWMAVKGVPINRIFQKLIDEQGLSVSWEEMAEYKKQLVRETPSDDFRLFPGFEELVSVLQKKYKLALTTSAHQDIVDIFMQQFNFGKYFDVIITASDIKNGKPHPEPFLTTAQKLGVKPEECVVIEDAVNGVESAKAAGCIVIAITNTFPAEKLQDADYVVGSLDEVKVLFEKRLI